LQNRKCSSRTSLGRQWIEWIDFLARVASGQVLECYQYI
jgi:hypothetical protein